MQALTEARAKKALERQGIALSERQFTFLMTYLSGGSKADALAAAGYAENAAWSVFESARLRSAISFVLENFLVGDAAPASLRALYQIVTDDKTAPGIRVQAANSLLDRAGFDAKRHERNAGTGKDASQMSREELQAEIDKLSREIEGRMVDVTPVSEPIAQQDIDMYE